MSRKVLVVEDDGIVAMGIELALKSLGYEVGGVADTAREAVRLSGELEPDVVLMDIRLKGQPDGIAAAQEITSQRPVPIVFLTAHSDKATLTRAMGPGSFGFLPKPFTVEQLKAAVEMALYRYDADRQLRSSLQLHVSTLDSLGVGVVAVDESGRVSLLNRVAETLTGWTADEARAAPAGTRIANLVSEVSGAPLPDPLEKALEGSPPAAYAEYALLVDRSGLSRPVDFSAAAVRREDGSLSGAAVIFRDLTEHQKAERERARLSQELERERQRLQALSAQLLIAQEEERQRLALEIHDELSQTLTALSIHLLRVRTAARETVAPLVDDSLQSVREVLGQVRELAWRIHPQVLDDRGLPEALVWLANEQGGTAGVEVTIVCRVEGERLPRALELACFRIAQEGLLNVLNHSRASRAVVTVVKEDGQLRLSVVDDGVGFDVAQAMERARRHESMGLLTLEERARLAGGHLEVRSAPGQGTEVKAVFPV